MPPQSDRKLSVLASVISLGAAAATILAGSAPATAAASHHAPVRHHQHHHHHHHSSRRHHHSSRRHHHAPKLKPVSVDGLVTAIDDSRVTVFASTSTVGNKTSHNTDVHLLVAHRRRELGHLTEGYAVHLVASGRGSTTHLIVPHVRHANTTPSPASVVIGEVKKVDDGELLVAQYSHEDGHHDDGVAKRTVTVDTSQATITVDGEPGVVKAGEFVSILGETQNYTDVASQIFAISDPGEVVRGRITSIDGTTITVNGEQGTTTLSLSSAEIPVYLNGSFAHVDKVQVGDRIAVVGVLTGEEEGFYPLIVFDFNRHDSAPCEHN